ncbi:hypothetical protein N665_1537s0002 [Sinapis alba]|nr:hypothetical protein N665_1537s0002 [Sinapis alba]
MVVSCLIQFTPMPNTSSSMSSSNDETVCFLYCEMGGNGTSGGERHSKRRRETKHSVERNEASGREQRRKYRGATEQGRRVMEQAALS